MLLTHLFRLESYTHLRNVLLVPLHNVMVDRELFQGEAKLAVCQELVMLGIAVILCNDLAGARVWADVSPPVVAPVSLVRLGPG